MRVVDSITSYDREPVTSYSKPFERISQESVPLGPV